MTAIAAYGSPFRLFHIFSPPFPLRREMETEGFESSGKTISTSGDGISK